MKLGIANVERDILKDLTARQFMTWKLYAVLEPFDETRQDYRIASIVQMLFNTNRGKDQKPLKLEDALLKFGEQEVKKKQTWQDQLMVARLMVAQAAGRPRDL